MNALEFLVALTQLFFVAIFAVTLLRAIRHATPANVDIALFFGAMAWRGLASLRHTGPALSVRGWRLLAAAFVLVAAIGTIGHWAGAVLPLVVAVLCLYNDPAVGRILQWIGLSL